MRRKIFVMIFLSVCSVFCARCSTKSESLESTKISNTSQINVTTKIVKSDLTSAENKGLQHMKKTMKNLQKMGWENVEIIDGEPDSKRWGSVILQPIDAPSSSVILSAIGQIEGEFGNPISVVVTVVFDEKSLTVLHTKTYYISSSGREALPSDFGKSEILSAEDPNLWEYMYSY